jgi:hypothetical protein
MLGLAISMDETPNGTVIETEDGREMICSDWPQDSDARIVCFRPTKRSAQVVCACELAADIGLALRLIRDEKLLRSKPDWFSRLEAYAAGAS